ncbi:MAG: PLP-dependent transferase [Candidatus Competibacteraceae bacterium]
MFAHTLPRFGIEARFADYRDIDAMGRLIDGKTKAVFCRSIGNPAANVVDFGALATRPRPGRTVDRGQHACRPVSVLTVRTRRRHRGHSLTKYMGGHGTSLGIIVDSGHFPWDQHKERFARLSEPDPSYHGVVYVEALGPAAFIGRARVVPLRNTGAAISPFNSFP